MADADKQIRVQIELDKTGSGGEAAQAELAAISGAQKTTADTTQKVGTESEKAAEKVKLFSGEGREMHRVIGELNHISPLLGEALSVAMHPVGGTIAAAPPLTAYHIAFLILAALMAAATAHHAGLARDAGHVVSGRK